MYYAGALSGVASDSIRERAASGREKLIERTYIRTNEAILPGGPLLTKFD